MMSETVDVLASHNLVSEFMPCMLQGFLSCSARRFVAACPCSSLGRLSHGEYAGGHDQFGDHSM